MPGGKGNINGSDGKLFSKENQPTNRRKSTKFLTDLLTKKLKGKNEIEIEGYDSQGQKVKITVPMPTKDIIVSALLRKAAKGDIYAIKEIFDRTEGKATQSVELSAPGGKSLLTNKTDEELQDMLKEELKKHLE